MYSFIFDYKDATGRDFHQGFCSTPLFVGTIYDAAQAIKCKLESQGYAAAVIRSVLPTMSLLNSRASKPLFCKYSACRAFWLPSCASIASSSFVICQSPPFVIK